MRQEPSQSRRPPTPVAQPSQCQPGQPLFPCPAHPKRSPPTARGRDPAPPARRRGVNPCTCTDRGNPGQGRGGWGAGVADDRCKLMRLPAHDNLGKTPGFLAMGRPRRLFKPSLVQRRPVASESLVMRPPWGVFTAGMEPGFALPGVLCPSAPLRIPHEHPSTALRLMYGAVVQRHFVELAGAGGKTDCVQIGPVLTR